MEKNELVQILDLDLLSKSSETDGAGPSIDGARSQSDRPSEFRNFLDLGENKPEVQTPISTQIQIKTISVSPSHLSSHVTGHVAAHWAGFLSGIASQIRQDLESHPARLLQLNRTRRETIALHLDSLANLPKGPTSEQGSDPAGGLRRWLETPRTPAQNRALKAYFEEIAWITLGQALVLKSWADRGRYSFKEQDLGKLNWALSSTLKAHIPMDRDGWLITKPNLYSWYNLPANIQSELWQWLEQQDLSAEGPSTLPQLIRAARRPESQNAEHVGYNDKFYESLWNLALRFGFDPSESSGPLKRKKSAFCLTLRDGTLLRSGPENIQWIGMDREPFQILLAELAELWFAPKAPPLWALGSGLEVHTRDQLQLVGSPMPSLLERIADEEACDIAFVFEERVQRGIYREQLERLPYFRKLKNGAPSLGTLQACVSLTKLRPNGLLIWVREEPLGPQEGAESLRFLLDHGKLVGEWDLTRAEHQLPLNSPLFSKYVYVFSRELALQVRHAHHPVRTQVQGSVRSYVEVPKFLASCFAESRPAENSGKELWKIHSAPSPTAQREWVDHWPEPSTHHEASLLENLRLDSVPLANLANIITPQKKHHFNGFYLFAGETSGLVTSVTSPDSPLKGKRDVFFIASENPVWTALLKHYLPSASVQAWLKHHADRKGGKLILSEALLKMIPVSGQLTRAMKTAEATGGLTTNPLNTSDPIQKAIYCAHQIAAIESTSSTLLSMIDGGGKIKWNILLGVISESERVLATSHPLVHTTGFLPNQVPITQIEKVKMPSRGIRFSTENGFHVHMGVDPKSPEILDILMDQLEGVEHPTWAEISGYLRLPRQLSTIKELAHEVMLKHAEITNTYQNWQKQLGECLEF